MTEKRYYVHKHLIKEDKVHDKMCHQFMNLTETVEHMNMYYQKYTDLKKENGQLKQQLYCTDEEGVCIKCEHHYLVKDEDAELGYYNLRCKKGHYECAKVSLKHCEDFKFER